MSVKAVLIDLDGVIYQGETVIQGAMSAIQWLVDQQIDFLFVTNTTSRPRQALVEKLKAYGLAVRPAQILTPPVAASLWLADHAPGPVSLFVPQATQVDFVNIPQVEADEQPTAVVLGDLSREWTYDRLNQAFRLLATEPKPALVALGMTRYWRTPEGLSLDVGPFVKALEYAADCEAVVMGKPSPEFFAAALKQLGSEAGDTLMIGDDIVGDIQGAQTAGIRGILVRTGKFRVQDLDGDIRAHAVLDSIAQLPAWLDAKGQ